MTVQPIQSNSESNSSFKTVVGYTAVGTILGYGAKYLVPATRQEFEESGIKETAKYLEAQQIKKFKTDIINDMKQSKTRTLAQDTFVKLFDNKKGVNYANFNKALNELGGAKSEAGSEFLDLISRVNRFAKNKSAVYTEMYINSYLKKIRPTVPFLVGGGIIGMLSGMFHNILKSGQTLDT